MEGSVFQAQQPHFKSSVAAVANGSCIAQEVLSLQEVVLGSTQLGYGTPTQNAMFSFWETSDPGKTSDTAARNHKGWT